MRMIIWPGYISPYRFFANRSFLPIILCQPNYFAKFWNQFLLRRDRNLWISLSPDPLFRFNKIFVRYSAKPQIWWCVSQPIWLRRRRRSGTWRSRSDSAAHRHTMAKWILESDLCGQREKTGLARKTKHCWYSEVWMKCLKYFWSSTTEYNW